MAAIIVLAILAFLLFVLFYGRILLNLSPKTNQGQNKP